MRPIDTIRQKIDPDLQKYHNTTLCRIHRKEDLKHINGVGLCALVHPVNKYVPEDPKYTDRESMFKVIIVNRPGVFWETDIINKFLVLVINQVKDYSDLGVGILVPSTFPADESVWNLAKKDSEGETLDTRKKNGVISKTSIKIPNIKPPELNPIAPEDALSAQNFGKNVPLVGQQPASLAGKKQIGTKA